MGSVATAAVIGVTCIVSAINTVQYRYIVHIRADVVNPNANYLSVNKNILRCNCNAIRRYGTFSNFYQILNSCTCLTQIHSENTFRNFSHFIQFSDKINPHEQLKNIFASCKNLCTIQILSCKHQSDFSWMNAVCLYERDGKEVARYITNRFVQPYKPKRARQSLCSRKAGFLCTQLSINAFIIATRNDRPFQAYSFI